METVLCRDEETSPLMAALRTIPLFEELPAALLARVTDSGRVFAAEAGDVLVSEGEVADRLYTVLSGAVRVLRREPTGLLEIATLRAGEIFGEMALLDGSPRSASVVAAGPTQLFVLDRHAFTAILWTSPFASRRLLERVSARLRDSNERLLAEMHERHEQLARLEVDRHRALAHLVAGVAHELNTPLGLVNIAASVIAEAAAAGAVSDPAAALEATRLIQSGVTRMAQLVARFKQLSAMQLGGKPEECDVRDAIREVVSTQKLAGSQLRVTVDELEEDPSWTGPREQFSLVLSSLLANVEQHAYAGAGGPAAIRLAADGERIEISVRDEGRGIEAEHLPHVFEPFYTTARGRGAAGLGLSIVHSLVGALGGEVAIASEPGRGTTVTLRLPRGAAAVLAS